MRATLRRLLPTGCARLLFTTLIVVVVLAVPDGSGDRSFAWSNASYNAAGIDRGDLRVVRGPVDRHAGARNAIEDTRDSVESAHCRR